jgi:hypothetical protein
MTAYILNLLDLTLTLYAISHGAIELNPLMQNIPFQIFYKIFVIGFLLLLLHKLKANKGIALCGVVYGGIDLYHIYNLSRLLL